MCNQAVILKQLTILISSLLFLQACQQNSEESATNSISPATSIQTPASHSHETAPSSAQLHGKVIEVIESAGYTYVQVDTNKGALWVAGPSTPFNKGDTATFQTSMPMKNFHSKSLDRNFDIIYFVNAFITADKTTAAHSKLTQQPTTTIVAKFDTAKGGQSIADIYANKDVLTNKAIKVRGKVIKFTGGVLGKNWIHIKDSSTKTDLTVTTDSIVKNGDIVLIEGILGRNRDFGYGYLYDVIVEDGKVTVE